MQFHLFLRIEFKGIIGKLNTIVCGMKIDIIPKEEYTVGVKCASGPESN